jgi:Bacterial Ig-like domain
VLSRRLALLMAAVGMVVLMGALASVAWAAPGAPRVVSTVPPDRATDVDRSTNIKAKFSEAMKASTINTNTFYLIEGHFTGCPSGGCISDPEAGTVRYNTGNRTAILDPTLSLLCSTEYTAVIEGTGDGDHLAVKDRGGTSMGRDYIFYFTTGGTGGGPCGF